MAGPFANCHCVSRLATQRTPSFTTTTLKDRSIVQLRFAQAVAMFPRAIGQVRFGLDPNCPFLHFCEQSACPDELGRWFGCRMHHRGASYA